MRSTAGEQPTSPRQSGVSYVHEEPHSLLGFSRLSRKDTDYFRVGFDLHASLGMPVDGGDTPFANTAARRGSAGGEDVDDPKEFGGVIVHSVRSINRWGTGQDGRLQLTTSPHPVGNHESERASAFYRRFDGETIVDAWINVDDLSASNTLHQLLIENDASLVFPPLSSPPPPASKRGKSSANALKNSGMVFVTGAVEIPLDSHDTGVARRTAGAQPAPVPSPSYGVHRIPWEHNVYTYVHCRVATGSSYPLDITYINEASDLAQKLIHVPGSKRSEEERSALELPRYDSFILSRPSLEEEAKRDKDPSAYYREYVVYDPSRVLVDYVVTFSASPSRQEQCRELARTRRGGGAGKKEKLQQDKQSTTTSPSALMCDNCAENPAAVYCSQDSAALCRACDRSMHPEDKPILARHDRIPVERLMLSGKQPSTGDPSNQSIASGESFGELQRESSRFCGGLPIVSACPYHPGVPAQYYDTVERRAKCIRCNSEYEEHHPHNNGAPKKKDADNTLVPSSWVPLETAYADARNGLLRADNDCIYPTRALLEKAKEQLSAWRQQTKRDEGHLLAEIDRIANMLRRDVTRACNERMEAMDCEESSFNQRLGQIAFLQSFGREGLLVGRTPTAFIPAVRAYELSVRDIQRKVEQRVLRLQEVVGTAGVQQQQRVAMPCEAEEDATLSLLGKLSVRRQPLKVSVLKLPQSKQHISSLTDISGADAPSNDQGDCVSQSEATEQYQYVAPEKLPFGSDRQYFFKPVKVKSPQVKPWTLRQRQPEPAANDSQLRGGDGAGNTFFDVRSDASRGQISRQVSFSLRTPDQPQRSGASTARTNNPAEGRSGNGLTEYGLPVAGSDALNDSNNNDNNNNSNFIQETPSAPVMDNVPVSSIRRNDVDQSMSNAPTHRSTNSVARQIIAPQDDIMVEVEESENASKRASASVASSTAASIVLLHHKTVEDHPHNGDVFDETVSTCSFSSTAPSTSSFQRYAPQESSRPGTSRFVGFNTTSLAATRRQGGRNRDGAFDRSPEPASTDRSSGYMTRSSTRSHVYTSSGSRDWSSNAYSTSQPRKGPGGRTWPVEGGEGRQSTSTRGTASQHSTARMR